MGGSEKKGVMIVRLDKFLKVSRLIKRRSLAKEVAEQNRIKVNGTVAKPAVNVQVGDEIEITFGQTIVTVKVQAVKEHVKKEEASLLYDVISEQKKSDS